MIRVRSHSRPMLLALGLVALIVVFFVLSGASGAQDKRTTTRSASRSLVNLPVYTASASTTFEDIYVGIDKGFFKKRGLNVSQVLGQTDPSTELISGAVHIAAGTVTTMYVADAAGADLKAIYATGANYESYVAKDPSIKTPADLKGKTIGIFSLNDFDVLITHEMMKQYGVSPSDYTLLAVGPSPNKLAAVQAGSISAAPLYPPTNFAAFADGLHQVFATSQLKAGQLPTFVIVRDKWAKAHRAVVVNYIRALNDARNWIFNPKNRAAAIAILVKHTQLPQDQATKSFNLFFKTAGRNYTKSGEWKASTIKAAVPELLAAKLITKALPYNEVVDTSYRKAALAAK